MSVKMEVLHFFWFCCFVFLLVFVSYAHIQLNVCNSEVWCTEFSNKIITVTTHLVQYTSELEKHPTHMKNTYTLFALTPLKVHY